MIFHIFLVFEQSNDTKYLQKHIHLLVIDMYYYIFCIPSIIKNAYAIIKVHKNILYIDKRIVPPYFMREGNLKFKALNIYHKNDILNIETHH